MAPSAEAAAELRAAQRAVDLAAQRVGEARKNRARALHRWDGVLTREGARRITGLSIGRIQQLIAEQREQGT